METNDYEKGCAQTTSRKAISGNIKGGGNSFTRKDTRNRGRISKV